MKSIKKNAALNVIKQICNIIFPMITFPYISRVLGASVYGKINFSASIVNYFSLIAAFGVSNYAIREGARIKDEKNGLSSFVSEVFSINILTTIISYIILGMLLMCWPLLRNYSLLIIIQSMSIFFTTLGV